MTEQAVSGHVCPECANHINEQGSHVDHHSDCPVVTNVWTVIYGGELVCYLCDTFLMEGDPYRMIPVSVDMDDDDILESAIGLTHTVSRPCCTRCTTLRLVRAPHGGQGSGGGGWGDRNPDDPL